MQVVCFVKKKGVGIYHIKKLPVYVYLNNWIVLTYLNITIAIDKIKYCKLKIVCAYVCVCVWVSVCVCVCVEGFLSLFLFLFFFFKLWNSVFHGNMDIRDRGTVVLYFYWIRLHTIVFFLSFFSMIWGPDFAFHSYTNLTFNFNTNS